MGIGSPGSLPTRSAPNTVVWLLFLLLVCLGVGYYAQILNTRFYTRSQPFYDSMSYNQELHTIMTVRRQQGVASALVRSCHINTVFLPNAVAALLPERIEPSRAVGIWIQIGELVLLLWSLFYYLTRIRGQTPWMAAIFLSPLLALDCLYGYHGGLSDFRMDLSLFFAFSMTAVWYLAAIETRRMLHYLVLGLCAGLACLTRATAPVFLLAGIGPLAVLDLLQTRPRRRAIFGLVLAVSTAAATGLWFYVVNFGYLQYYYFVWNTDANAGLSWQQSIRHFEFVGKHIGERVLCFVLAYHTAWAVAWLIRNRRIPRVNMDGVRNKLASLDLRLLWLGISPAALLVVRGAGLNPFVCMPSVFGTVLLVLIPAGAPKGNLSKGWMAGLATIAVLCCVSAGNRGWKDHAGGAINSMAAHKQTLETIVSDTLASGRDQASFAALHVYCLNTDSLHNVLLFDVKEAEATENGIKTGGVQLRRDLTFSQIVAEADWKGVSGRGVNDKLDTLVQRATENVDYLVIPNEKTAHFLQECVSYNVINRYSVSLRNRLLKDGQFVKISENIANGPDEVVSVYRNARRDHVAAARGQPILVSRSQSTLASEPR